ncbi:hypothetical protein QF041_004544 [Paenibacillus sp. W2I17]|nr:hypothetical protein [Paenibacillus sp. W2I17]
MHGLGEMDGRASSLLSIFLFSERYWPLPVVLLRWNGGTVKYPQDEA